MKGTALLKARSIKSKYEDVPASIEFSVIRRYRDKETKTIKTDYLKYVGRLNGWLTSSTFKYRDVQASQEKNKFHRWMTAAGNILKRSEELKKFSLNAEKKFEALLSEGTITPQEREKLSEQLKKKMPR